jgi:UPF0176 protein
MLTPTPAAPSIVQYLNIAAYKFVAIDDLPSRRKILSEKARDCDLRGTVLLSPEGINLFLAGPPEGVNNFLAYLQLEERFSDLKVKRSWTDFQPFRRLLVKLKKEIIAFGIESVRPQERTSPKLSPEELKRWLDEGRELTLLDTRNDYEVGIGTFEGAIDFNIHHFRNFPEAVKSLPDDAKAKPIVMFCTGGIRCEKAGPYMEQVGFREVYQLDGGILNYFERCGDAHYAGDCFVFDHRVAVTPKLEPSGAKLCFECQAVLTADDIASEKYVPEVSCPHCYTSQEEQSRRIVEHRHRLIRTMAEDLPGCKPYENRQPMFVAKRFAGWNLIDWVVETYRGRTRDKWLEACRSHRIKTGQHYLNASQVVDEHAIVKEGQVFVLVQEDYIEPPVNGNIQIVYEDKWLVAVNKPAPLPVHASGQFSKNTLEYLLDQVYRPEKLFLGHRLDSDTSGLLVISRRHALAGKLQQQFSNHSVEKVYLARVHGTPASECFESNEPISPKTLEGGSRGTSPDGQTAHTTFRLLRRLTDATCLIEARPTTGRTHQIRLHLAHMGLPIVGDRLYGKDAKNPLVPSDHSKEMHDRLCLHAWKLSLTHPATNERIAFEAPAPDWADDLS